MKTLVLYFTNTGNNAFLATKLTELLKADSEELQPRLSSMPGVLFSSWTGLPSGLRTFEHKLEDYDSFVVSGPIWMGTFLSPMRDAVKRLAPLNKPIYYATCCGSGDDEGDGKFGFNAVFKKARKHAKQPNMQCEAFPIKLILTKEELKDDEAVMNARLTDETYGGKMKQRVESLVSSMNG